MLFVVQPYKCKGCGAIQKPGSGEILKLCNVAANVCVVRVDKLWEFKLIEFE